VLAWPVKGGAGALASGAKHSPRQPLAIAIAIVVGATAYEVTLAATTAGPHSRPGAADPLQQYAVGSVLGPDALRAIGNLRLNTGSFSALARDRVVDDAVGPTLPAIPDPGAAALLPDTALCE